MPNPKELTREAILRAASKFRWTRKGMKWTVIVGDRELPARPLVLEAAGVPPNDPTNSHQAVEILRRLGFETRYDGADGNKTGGMDSEFRSQGSTDLPSIIDLFAEITKSVPEEAWERVPKDLSINLDHYLYGAKKTQE